MKPTFPNYLTSYSALRDHFEENFNGLPPRDRGINFAKVVQELIPYTNFGSRGFEKAELQKESHDEGVDLIAEHSSSNQKLCIQSKYTLSDKNGFDSVISNFQGFHKKHFTDSAGPLFAHGGVSVGDEPTVYYQLIAGNNLEGIIKKYEDSKFSSIQFYQHLKDAKQLEIIDGPKILELLKTAYRKANILPSDYELTFETDFIEKDNVYIGILSGKELRRLYGVYGDALFYENIRNFLTSRNKPDSGTAINAEIIKTVRKESDQFLSRNNGIVFKARDVQVVNKKTIRLNESSVVNGCQTTMCIVSYGEEENDVYVTAKVVGTDQAWDVARAANLQNDVSRFELEIAQFLRPQVVNKAASHEGYRVIGNESAFTLLDSIYQYELMYEDLRGLFVGIFSNSPNNIFDTNYLELSQEVISKFYEKDPEGTQLLTKLFQIQQMANKSMQVLQTRMNEKNLSISAFQRFFKDNKAAYRAFFTILASCSLSEIDLSQKESDVDKRYRQVNEFLENTLVTIHNEPEKFQRYYRFAMNATTTIIPPEKDTDAAKQLIWQVIRRANFGLLLERMQLEALNYEI